MMCCKCGSQMSWCLGINRKDGNQWRCQKITPASVCCATTSIRHGSWFRQSKFKFMEILFLTYDIVRRVPACTIQQEHQFGSAILTNWANLCREVLLDYVLGNHGPKPYSSPSSRLSLRNSQSPHSTHLFGGHLQQVSMWRAHHHG
jgi:hypothetical protein